MDKKQREAFLSRLRRSKLVNLSALSKKNEQRMRWRYINGKLNPEEEFASVPINKRLIHYQVNDATKAAFLFYQTGIYLPHKDAMVSLRLHATLSDDHKKRLKKELGWKKGDIIIGFLQKEEIEFGLAKLEDLGITDAKPFSKHEANAVRSKIVTDMKEGMLKNQQLLQELEGNWLR